jgi:hypothetical protein
MWGSAMNRRGAARGPVPGSCKHGNEQSGFMKDVLLIFLYIRSTFFKFKRDWSYHTCRSVLTFTYGCFQCRNLHTSIRFLRRIYTFPWEKLLQTFKFSRRKVSGKPRLLCNMTKCLYTVSQEERSIFWEVTVSVIASKICICTCVLFRTVSEIEIFTVRFQNCW